MTERPKTAGAQTFAELFENSIKQMKEGEVVRGTVLSMDADHVQVDIGFKSEGLIPTWEFMDDDGTILVRVGDVVDVTHYKGKYFGDDFTIQEKTKYFAGYLEQFPPLRDYLKNAEGKANEAGDALARRASRRFDRLQSFVSRFEIQNGDMRAQPRKHHAGLQPHAAAATGDVDDFVRDLRHREIPHSAMLTLRLLVFEFRDSALDPTRPIPD